VLKILYSNTVFSNTVFLNAVFANALGNILFATSR